MVHFHPPEEWQPSGYSTTYSSSLPFQHISVQFQIFLEWHVEAVDTENVDTENLSCFLANIGPFWHWCRTGVTSWMSVKWWIYAMMNSMQLWLFKHQVLWVVSTCYDYGPCQTNPEFNQCLVPKWRSGKVKAVCIPLPITWPSGEWRAHIRTVGISQISLAPTSHSCGFTST